MKHMLLIGLIMYSQSTFAVVGIPHDKQTPAALEPVGSAVESSTYSPTSLEATAIAASGNFADISGYPAATLEAMGEPGATVNATINAWRAGDLNGEGEFTITDADGQPVDVDGEVYLCRCGGSGNKPFCDGTHRSIGIKK